MALNLVMILLNLFPLFVAKSMAVPRLALPGCTEKCGNLTIPYPFGVKKECFRDPSYLITCERQRGGTFKAYRHGLHHREVVDIKLLEAQITWRGQYYAYQCFSATGNRTEKINYKYDLTDLPFTLSASRNKFTAIGCDTVAYITDEKSFTTGCVSLCNNVDNVRDGFCSGFGCCETTIPSGLKIFNMTLGSVYNHTKIWRSNPCSFAFLADKDWFTFQLADLSGNHSFIGFTIPVVMDWAIGNQTCEQAHHDTKSYACGPNSYCSDSINGPGYGYRCNCRDGFEGNPYLPQVGCQDIDECENEHSNSCHWNAKCHNTLGSYNCHCRKDYQGDGWKNGTGCTEELQKGNQLILLIAGAGIGFIFVAVSLYFLYWGIQRRRIIKRREKFFQQNGGLLLQQQIASRRGVTDIARIFTIEQLKKASNNFDESRIIGQGGYGTVFRGILSNGKLVAIKKSKILDKGQIIHFINEVDILSQINHRNVVKLLGCCLETEVPLLVYEFIPNGTLFQHIHNENQAEFISWETRLRIAAETAGALGYLHFAHSIPILHRDVKSSNILLDDNYVAKVSDFGASRLAPLNRTQATTLVQGTLGYLDPECFHTGRLIDKSDVYSFGVVLAELLTKQKPILSEGTEECKSLAMHFVSSMDDNNLFQILDNQVVNEEKIQQLVAVAELTRRCLKVKGEDRPTMKEVALELDSLRMLSEDPWILQKDKGAESFLDGPSASSTTSGQEYLGDSMMLSLEVPR